MPEWIQSIIGFALDHPFFTIGFLLFISGCGFPLPEDVTIALAGYIAHRDTSGTLLVPLGLWTIFWVMAGDSTMFFLGRFWGAKALELPVIRQLLHPERQGQVKDGFKRYGPFILFLARFMPGLRSPIFFTAGTMHVPYTSLLWYDGGAAMLSVPAIYVFAWWAGAHLDAAMDRLHEVQMYVIPVVVVGLGFIAWRIFTAKPETTAPLPAEPDKAGKAQ